MGRDKALIRMGGTPMVVRVAEALRVAGAHDVVAIGREAEALASLGLATVPDAWPGAGPAGGIVTALAWAGPGSIDDPGGPDDAIVLVVGCDLVAPSPVAMAATVAALARDPAASVAVPGSGGRRQWAHAAWRRSAGPSLGAVLDAGERAVHRVVASAGLSVVEVDGIDPAALADADTPGDLPDGEGS
jgi:molybdopterin-guanine dinucleotide biosynthesis protein A